MPRASEDPMPGGSPADSATKSRDYSIAVLERALDVLELIADAPAPLGATDIARRLGVTKSATYRILVTLEARGYLTKDEATPRYTIGPRLLGFLLRSDGRERLVRIVRPRLEALSERMGETANLGVLEGSQVRYVDIVESPHDLRMAARVGARDDLHSTALGKAMLAFLPEVTREAVLRGPLRRKTSRTVVDADRLRADLEVVRRTGIAAEYGENEAAASCFGVPLFGPAGEVAGAISLAGPEGRMRDAGLVTIRELLHDAAGVVTSQLGGAWPTFDPNDETGS